MSYCNVCLQQKITGRNSSVPLKNNFVFKSVLFFSIFPTLSGFIRLGPIRFTCFKHMRFLTDVFKLFCHLEY